MISRPNLRGLTMSRLRLKKKNELGPHKKDEPGLEGRETGLGTLDSQHV